MKKQKFKIVILISLFNVIILQTTYAQTAKVYHKNSKVKSTFNSQTNQFRKYYYNGTNLDGNKVGQWKYYYDNGKLKSIGEFLNEKTIGEWKNYYENGKLKSVGIIVNGKFNGTWKLYFTNEQLKSVGNYTDGKSIGEWKYYHFNSQLYRIGFWEKGKLMHIISCFDGQGKKCNKGTLKNGNGTVNDYNIDGKLIKLTTYKNGTVQK